MGDAQEPRATRSPFSRTVIVIILGLIVVAFILPGIATRGQRRRAQQASCAENLRALRSAMLSYAQDYDDRLPLGVPLQDLLGKDWTRGPRFWVRGRFPHKWAPQDAGPVGAYAKNAGLYFCAADPATSEANLFPKPGLSYRWNTSLGGQYLPDIPDQTTTALIWDRAAWHFKKRNVMFLDGHLEPIKDADLLKFVPWIGGGPEE